MVSVIEICLKCLKKYKNMWGKSGLLLSCLTFYYKSAIEVYCSNSSRSVS